MLKRLLNILRLSKKKSFENPLQSGLIWKGLDRGPNNLGFERSIYDSKKILDILERYDQNEIIKSEKYIEWNLGFLTLPHWIEVYSSEDSPEYLEIIEKYNALLKIRHDYLESSDDPCLFIYSNNPSKLSHDLFGFLENKLSLVKEYDIKDTSNPFKVRLLNNLQEPEKSSLLSKLRQDLDLPKDQRKLFYNYKGSNLLHFGLSFLPQICTTGYLENYTESDQNKNDFKDLFFLSPYPYYSSKVKSNLDNLDSIWFLGFDSNVGEKREAGLPVYGPSLKDSLETVLYFKEKGHFPILENGFTSFV